MAAGLYLASLGGRFSMAGLVAKPLPALCLAVVAWRAAPDRYARLVSAGLAVSALADALMEWRFLAGLACFLVAHIVYATAFWSDSSQLRPARAVPFAAFGLGMFSFLRPGLGDQALPVAVYVAAICVMMWRAAARVGATPRGPTSAWLALAGAVIFAGSDSLIALDRFHAPIAGVRYPILILYWLGQLGIALSARRTEPAPIY
jgi:uncharacterized membrane protein YhhN